MRCADLPPTRSRYTRHTDSRQESWCTSLWQSSRSPLLPHISWELHLAEQTSGHTYPGLEGTSAAAAAVVVTVSPCPASTGLHRSLEVPAYLKRKYLRMYGPLQPDDEDEEDEDVDQLVLPEVPPSIPPTWNRRRENLGRTRGPSVDKSLTAK